MVTVSLELWQAGTTPGGQRCRHSSQDRPAGGGGLRGGPGSWARGRPLPGCAFTGCVPHEGIITTAPQAALPKALASCPAPPSGRPPAPQPIGASTNGGEQSRRVAPIP